MVKIFTCIGRGAVIYIVRPRTATSTSPSSVEDTAERTAVPGRDATGAAAIDPLPTSTVTAIITAYLIAFNFTPQSYKKSANRRLCQSIKSGLSHQKCFLRPQPVFRCILSRCVLTSVADRTKQGRCNPSAAPPLCIWESGRCVYLRPLCQ